MMTQNVQSVKKEIGRCSILMNAGNNAPKNIKKEEKRKNVKRKRHEIKLLTESVGTPTVLQL